MKALIMWPTLDAEITRARSAVTGIMDYSYAPYALGDTFTWLANLQVIANEKHLNAIDLMLIASSQSPASPLQPNITAYNYTQKLDPLLPAFFCSSMVRSVNVYEKPRQAAHCILGTMLARGATWPTLFNHLRRKLDYASHHLCNAFYFEHGWLPRLTTPSGFADETAKMRARYIGEKVPVTINIRQRGLTHDPAVIKRDSNADTWWHFLRRAADTWPEVTFILVGDYNEWSRRFAHLKNVFIPRMHGYALGHELSMLFESTLFMGTSSGFSAAATFSDVPYVITKYEHQSAPFVGVSVGDKRLPFAHPYQMLDWQDETMELLMALFAEGYEAAKEHGRPQIESAPK